MPGAIEEGDTVRFSDLYLSTITTVPSLAARRRGLAGKSRTYPTKVIYREVLWEDFNRVEEVREEWLVRA